jgi:response regulator NasT
MNTPTERPLRIAVADDERDTRQFFEEFLKGLGHSVATAESGRRLVEVCRTTHLDLVITDIKMPDMDGFEAAATVNKDRPVPVVVVSAYHDDEMLRRAGAEYVMGYLVKPVKPTDLHAAVALAVGRFDHQQKARQESAELRQALEDRKVIERAKGAVVRRVGLGEDEAYRRMQRYSSEHNLKLAETARRILAAEETFHTLDKLGG